MRHCPECGGIITQQTHVCAPPAAAGPEPAKLGIRDFPASEYLFPRTAPGPIPVIIESPYAGDVQANLTYLRACLRDSLLRGEAPFASHALYTQPGVLRDDVESERAAGIHAGFAWRRLAQKTVVYTDRGISGGMRYGIEHAKEHGHSVEYRELGHG